MRNILRSARKYIGYLIFAPIAIMLEVILEVYIPRVMTQLVDVGIPSHDLSVVTHFGLIMIGMSLLSLVAGTLATYLSSTGGIGFGTELRKTVFDKIEDFSFENIDKFQSSSLITRLTTDVNYIQNGMMMFTRVVFRAPFMMIMAIIMALRINSRLVKIFFVAMPIILIGMVLVGYFAMPLFKKMMEHFDKLNQTVQEDLTNIRVVKAYVRGDYEKKRFSETNYNLMESSIRIELLMSAMTPIMMMIIYGVTVAILWNGGQMIIYGEMTTGELISFISYIMQILMGLIMIGMIFVNIVQLRGSINRINEVLNDKITLVDGKENWKVEEGSVEFRNVDFAYSAESEEKVLKNINMVIKPAETIGILGSTGSGKTTLVNLIPRLYDVTNGEVLVSGHDVREYKLKELRDNVAMVLQQNVLFSGTIKDNLKWGDANANDEEIMQACKYAQAHDFIMSFPDQYDTELGQGGVNLSGGQKQRLCIARALLKKPKIIILDDSTSAVDTATDSLIRKALHEQLSDTTTIIIAQRVASVLEADKVAIIDNGRIVDYDSPENLLKHNEIFQEVYYTQMKGVEENAA